MFVAKECQKVIFEGIGFNTKDLLVSSIESMSFDEDELLYLNVDEIEF